MQLSIIIPMYNSEQYVESCLDHVLMQDLIELCEIVVVDDGSSDNTFQILKKYEAENTNIRVIHQDNCGVSVARNVGINLAEGDWIVFLDSDDTIKQGFILDIITNINKNPNIDLLIYSVNELDGNDKIIDDSKISGEMLLNKALANKPIENVKADFNLVTVWNKVYNKKFLMENNILFAQGIHWAEDLLFNCKVYKKIKNKQFLSGGFYFYNQENSGSITKKYHKNAIESVRNYQREIIETLESGGDFGDVSKAVTYNLWKCWEVAFSNMFKAYMKEESLFKANARLKEVKRDKEYLVMINRVSRSIFEYNKKIKIKYSLLVYAPLLFCIIERRNV